MGSFHSISYFSVALSAEIKVIHIQKNTSTIQIFSP